MLVPFNGSGETEFSGKAEPHRFRYSKTKFQINLAISVALTVMICVLTWMVLGIWGSVNRDLYTYVTGLVFFVFISAKSIRRFFQNETILAIQPTGLLDKRWSEDLVTWDSIKEITLGHREEDVLLQVWLWPHGSSKVVSVHKDTPPPDFKIDLDVLEGDANSIVNLIAKYHAIKPELN